MRNTAPEKDSLSGNNFHQRREQFERLLGNGSTYNPSRQNTRGNANQQPLVSAPPPENTPSQHNTNSVQPSYNQSQHHILPPTDSPQSAVPIRAKNIGTASNSNNVGGRQEVAIGNSIFQKIAIERRAMVKLCAVELLLAAIVMAGGILCIEKASDYCPHRAGIWTSILFLLTAILGIASGFVTDNRSIHSDVAHLVLCSISAVLCVVGVILSESNWKLNFWEKYEIIENRETLEEMHKSCREALSINKVNCILNSYMTKTDDFKERLLRLKFGIAVNSVQLILSVVLVVLFAISATICMKRICSSHRVHRARERVSSLLFS